MKEWLKRLPPLLKTIAVIVFLALLVWATSLWLFPQWRTVQYWPLVLLLVAILGVTAFLDQLSGARNLFVPQIPPSPVDTVLSHDSEASEASAVVKLSNVPSLPLHFLPREDELAALKTTVLRNDTVAGEIERKSRIIGVQGMGGIGKSVLATALARDAEIRQHFNDGIFWLTLGRAPDLVTRQAQLAQALSEKQVMFDDAQQGKARLEALLVDKKCLVVLDDVWETAHATAFNVLDSTLSQLLITTRNIELCHALGAEIHILDLPDEEKALTLLAQTSNEARDSVLLDDRAREIAEECGKLPLALAMIGSMVRDQPNPWQRALKRLQKKDLSRIGRQFPDYPYPNLLRAIEVSVEALARDGGLADLDPVERYLDFAIFPDNIPVPLKVLATFWGLGGLDELDVEDLTQAFVNRSLARRDGTECLTLHDLQMDYVRQQAGDIATRHDRLLDAYGLENWLNLVGTEPYLRDHLAHHLSNSTDPMRALAIVTPGFRRAKLQHFHSDYSFAQDLELITRKLERGYQLSNLPAVIRCSFVQALISSLTHQVPPEILSTLVWFEQGERAVELATLTPNEKEKVEQFLAIAGTAQRSGREPQFTKQMLQEAASITKSLDRTQAYEGQKDEFMAEIARQAASLDRNWCQELLDEIESPNIQTRIKLIIVGENYDQDREWALALLDQALPIASTNTFFATDLARALAKVGPHDLRLVHQIIDSISPQFRTYTSMEIVNGLLETDHSQLALSVADRIDDQKERTRSLCGVARHLVGQNSVVEACGLIGGLPFNRETVWSLLGYIEELPLDSAEFGLDMARKASSADVKCLIMAATAQLFAKAGELDRVQEILGDIRVYASQQPQGDRPIDFLEIEIGRMIGRVAMTHEDEAIALIQEWESSRYGEHLAAQVSMACLDQNVDLALTLSGLVQQPAWRASILAGALFRLPQDDPRIPELRDSIERLLETSDLGTRNSRQVRAYLLGAEGEATPEQLLAIWDETQESVRQMKAQANITIRISNPSDRTIEEIKERDEILTGLALAVSRKSVDRAVSILSLVLDETRHLDGLARVADSLSPHGDNGGEKEENVYELTLSERIFTAVRKLAHYDPRLAMQIAENVADRRKRSIAYSAIAVSTRDNDPEAARQYLERALAIAQTPPHTAYRALTYMELNDCLSEDPLAEDLLLEAYAAIPFKEIAGAVPELVHRVATSLARSGDEEKAFSMVERMPSGLVPFDSRRKVEALLDVAEAAFAREKEELGKEIVRRAYEILAESGEVVVVPRLAGLVSRYDQEQALTLFDVAVNAVTEPGYRDAFLVRDATLRNIAFYQARLNHEAAIEAAERISDPYLKAYAFISIAKHSDLAPEALRDLVDAARELLLLDSESVSAKAGTLLNLIDIDDLGEKDTLELLWDVVHAARRIVPAEQITAVDILLETHSRFKRLGDEQSAAEVLSDVEGIIANMPFYRAHGMARLARVFAESDRPRALELIYSIIRHARSKGYDEMWETTTAIIPPICALGGRVLVEAVYRELKTAESFVPTRIFEHQTI